MCTFKRRIQRRAVGIVEVLDVKDCFPECVGVELPAVADAVKIGDGDGLW